MKKQFAWFLISALLLVSVGCSTTQSKKIAYQPLNPPELDAFQISHFTGSKEDVFTASRTALEAQGYIVSSVDYSSGFIGASSAAIIVNTDVTPQGDDIRVQINAIDRSYIYGVVTSLDDASRYGLPYIGGLFSLWDYTFHRKHPLTKREDGIIEDSSLYQSLFNKISDALDQSSPADVDTNADIS